MLEISTFVGRVYNRFNFRITKRRRFQGSFNKSCVPKDPVGRNSSCMTRKSDRRETRLRKRSDEGQVFNEQRIVCRRLALIMGVTLEIDVDDGSARCHFEIESR